MLSLGEAALCLPKKPHTRSGICRANQLGPLHELSGCGANQATIDSVGGSFVIA